MRSLTHENTLNGLSPAVGACTHVAVIGTTRSRLQRQQNLLWMLLISMSALAIFLALYILRALDDNRLSSWWWVFDTIPPARFFLMLVAGIVLAYGFSKVSLRGISAAPFLFLTSFLVTASLWQQPEVIVDAARHFMQAKYLELYGIGYFAREWGHSIPAWTDLPLIPLINGLIFQIFGESRIAIQVFTSLLFSGSVLLTYAIGKTLWSTELGWLAAVLLLGMPYLLAQVPLMMVDVAAMFFLTLAVLAIIMAVSCGGPLLCMMAAVAITLAMLAKYSNWLMLSVIPVILLCYVRLGWKVIFARGLAMVAGVLLMMGVFIYAKSDVVLAQLGLLSSFQAPALGRWGESLLSMFFFQIHPFISLAALASIFLAIKRRDARYAIIGWMLLIVMLIELRRIRYMLVLMPMLALMAAYGLQTIRQADYRKFIALNAALTTILLTLLGFLPFFQSMSANNLKQAGEYLDSIHAGATEVHLLPQTHSMVNPEVAVPLLDLFTAQPLVYHGETDNPPNAQTLSTLPLRWTWEVDSTAYLARSDPENAAQMGAMVIIQSDADQAFPDDMAERMHGYRLQQTFSTTNRIFRFNTIVKIYTRV